MSDAAEYVINRVDRGVNQPDGQSVNIRELDVCLVIGRKHVKDGRKPDLMHDVIRVITPSGDVVWAAARGFSPY